ncbi:MAG: hypothetical protein DWQ42_19280, partial [Planctomycetota bacterium]
MATRFTFATFALLACWLVASELRAQPNPPVSGAGCNNPNYDPAPTTFGGFGSMQLCNDPLADGLFTEDGVTGYQYIYDYFLASGAGGGFHLGGTVGPLGPAGAFKGNDSAWYRESDRVNYAGNQARGVWQVWGNQSVHDGVVGQGDSHNQFGFGGASQVNTTAPVWTDPDNAALGDTTTDVWDTSVTYSPGNDWFATGGTSFAGQPIPWAAHNPWHLPSEYGYSSEFMAPGSAAVTPDTGLGWQSYTTIFAGGPMALQHTIRIVAPYEPGSINYGIFGDPSSGVITGPNGAPVPQGPTSCLIGDVNCDGFVEIGADILTAFTNFTGPGSFGKVRATGDVHGPATATTAVLGHDGDVDVSDILTIFGAFTGPPPDEGSGGLGGPADAGDPSIPDLIYDASTGEVTLDADGSSIIGYSLQNATN